MCITRSLGKSLCDILQKVTDNQTISYSEIFNVTHSRSTKPILRKAACNLYHSEDNQFRNAVWSKRESVERLQGIPNTILFEVICETRSITWCAFSYLPQLDYLERV